ncbi:cell division protein FtsL [Falsihalocynthiibacter sp. SS001]|uniref:cell division protein FtsL n=1 Tax=Falsihalocynthiibacter sp. SS001 TaxID=3349698 RepID=UPI0036D23A12
MRSLYIAVTAMLVLGLAFWAYNENYKTQSRLKQVAQIQRMIGLKREHLAILNAEWAYQNRPERLRQLAEINFDRLGLLPLLPEQFGHVDQVQYHIPTVNGSFPELMGGVEVSAPLVEDGQ